MTKIEKAFFYASFIFLIALNANAQNQTKIDSLKSELLKYETHKKELGIATESLADTVKIKLYEKLWSNNLHYNNAEALKYAKDMVNLSEKIAYHKGEAEGYMRMGYVFEELGDFPTAISNNQKAILIQIEQKDSAGLAGTYVNMGVISSKLSNFTEALRYLEMSFKLSELLHDDYQMAVCLTDIGIIYKLQMKYPEALNYYEKAKTIFEKINEPDGVIACLINIGDIYVLQEQLPRAIANFKKALQINVSDYNTSANTYNSLAKAYLEKTDYDTALQYANLAYQLFKKSNDKYGLALTYLQQAAIYQKKGQIALAIFNAENGLEIANEIGEIEFSKDAHKLLAALYKTNGNYKQALYNQELFKQFNDSIFNTEKEKKFTQLQMTYQFEKVQDSLATEHAKEIALSGVELKTQKKIRNYGLIGMSLIIALLVFSIYQRNKISIVKKQQALELERTRISQDLHDDLGSGLTGIMMLSEQIQFRENKELLDKNIDKIKVSSRQMVDQMANIIWAMDSKNDSLENLIRYTQHFIQDFFENQPVQLIFEIPESIQHFVLNGLIRRNIFLVVKETLNNIYKYASATHVTFEVSIKGKEILITISDDGIGFDTAATRPFGNGLKNMKSRMVAINGGFILTSKPGHGTVTRISFPLSSQNA